MKRINSVLVLALLFAVATLAACGGGASSSPTAPSNPGGTWAAITTPVSATPSTVAAGQNLRFTADGKVTKSGVMFDELFIVRDAAGNEKVLDKTTGNISQAFSGITGFQRTVSAPMVAGTYTPIIRLVPQGEVNVEHDGPQIQVVR